MTERDAKEILEIFSSQRIKHMNSMPNSPYFDRKKADEFTYALRIAIETLSEIQQYRAIGTVTECQEAMKKQKPKKPIMKPYYEDMEEEYLCCPTCGDILTDRIPASNKDFYFHCLNCGQAFLWERDTE